MHLGMLAAVSCWAANMVAIKEALFGFTPLALAQVGALLTALLFGILFLSRGILGGVRILRGVYVTEQEREDLEAPEKVADPAGKAVE